jgi:hypothetical protein
MSSWETASLAIVVATGLTGLAGGRLWARLRSGSARRSRKGKLTALRAELDRQTLRAGQLEADLHAQQARGFALERELEARESDWAQSSPVPFSFDAQTFQIDRSLHIDPMSRAGDAERIAALEQQVRDLQDLLAKVSARPRPSRARSQQAPRQAPAWVELVAANSVHGGLEPTDADPRPTAPPSSGAGQTT